MCVHVTLLHYEVQSPELGLPVLGDFCRSGVSVMIRFALRLGGRRNNKTSRSKHRQGGAHTMVKRLQLQWPVAHTYPASVPFSSLFSCRSPPQSTCLYSQGLDCSPTVTLALCYLTVIPLVDDSSS